LRGKLKSAASARCDTTALLYYPFTDDFPEAATTACLCTATALTGALLSRPLPRRTATIALTAAIWLAALCPAPAAIPSALRFGPNANLLVLQISATVATLAGMLAGVRGLGLLAGLLQLALFGLGVYLRESSFELVAAQVVACGVLLGFARLRARCSTPSTEPPPTTSLVGQDFGIFVTAMLVAALMSRWAFGGFIFNGDEVANSFQADVYGHLRAYAPVPPCPSMFENYWVFRHQGRAFSQYTPGWPLFMAAFQRLGVIWLAGPTMAGILAVGVARLSRRLAFGLGGTRDVAERIVRLAGPLGAFSALLGPSMLLNAASRFSHTMVCACFAWAVESACVVSERDVTRSRAWGYGLVLGAATSLGLATRPADGGMLGIGVFSYFVWALARRRVGWRSLLATALAFTLFAGLTALILRLQLGSWFRTAYSISGSVHPEAELKLSAPGPEYVKLAIPLAVGAYSWWPSAFALALAGHLQALGGRERRVVLMLGVSAVALMTFYSFVEFGRFSYDGLGPRYVLPLVVMLAPATAALLAPPLQSLLAVVGGRARLRSSLRPALPGALALAAMVYGVVELAPHVYPLAKLENAAVTAPLRAAAELGLKHAIVMLESERLLTHNTNLAQNRPFEPNPDVLFLNRNRVADEVCARRSFPGRKWYRADRAGRLTPY
jgi:hypothetical protein